MSPINSFKANVAELVAGFHSVTIELVKDKFKVSLPDWHAHLPNGTSECGPSASGGFMDLEGAVSNFLELTKHLQLAPGRVCNPNCVYWDHDQS